MRGRDKSFNCMPFMLANRHRPGWPHFSDIPLSLHVHIELRRGLPMIAGFLRKHSIYLMQLICMHSTSLFWEWWPTPEQRAAFPGRGDGDRLPSVSGPASGEGRSGRGRPWSVRDMGCRGEGHSDAAALPFPSRRRQRNSFRRADLALSAG